MSEAPVDYALNVFPAPEIPEGTTDRQLMEAIYQLEYDTNMRLRNIETLIGQTVATFQSGGMKQAIAVMGSMIPGIGK